MIDDLSIDWTIDALDQRAIIEPMADGSIIEPMHR